MNLYILDKLKPEMINSKSCWLAPNCHIIGNVEIHSSVSIWFGAIIRGDNDKITVNRKSNIQENSILHTDKGFPLNIGEGCTIGHSSTLHGCKISSNTLIGMGSTLLNGSSIGKNCIVGAGSLIVQNQVITEGSLAIGRPAKIVRKLSKTEIISIQQSAKIYTDKIKIYKNKLF
mgnify:CR=1 FL=1